MTEVEHRPESSRFELACDGGPAVLTYQRSEAVVVLDHTLVPGSCEGQGLGSALVRAALTWAAQEQLAVVPRCWFVRGWLDRHPGEIPVTVV